MSGSQNWEGRNVDRPIFRNFQIANIKITKDELFDNFIFEFIFNFQKLLWHPKYLIIFQVCEILMFQMVELNFFHFPNC